MEMFNNLFTGATLLALLTYVGYQLRSFPKLIWEQIRKKIIYTVHIEETSELYNYFEKWLLKYHESKFKNVTAVLSCDSHTNKPLKDSSDKDINKDERLILKHYTDTFVLKYKNKKLLINKGREKFEHASDFRSAFFNNFKIEGLLAKEKINELLQEVIEYNKKIKITTQYLYTNTHYGDWNCFGEVYGKIVDGVVLRQKNEIISDIKKFLSNEEWYIKRGLAYKRGFLFYGSPGNGKTSFCLALAKYFNRNIQFLNLNDIEKDTDLFRTFGNIKNNSILVIEDIDAIFGNRDKKKKISFSGILNCMDGAFSKYGIIVIMTTNHYDKIDSALIREGRIDVKVKIDNPEKDMVEEYLSIFYDRKIQLNHYDKTYSMAKIQEICLRNISNSSEVTKVLESTNNIPVLN